MPLVKKDFSLGQSGVLTSGAAGLYLVVSLVVLSIVRPLGGGLIWPDVTPAAAAMVLGASLVWLILMGAACMVGGLMADAAESTWAKTNVFLGTLSLALVSTVVIQLPWGALVDDYAVPRPLGPDWIFIGSMLGAALLIAVAVSAFARRLTQKP